MRNGLFTLLIAGAPLGACGQTLDVFEFADDAGTVPVPSGPDLGTTVNVRFRPADILMFVDSSSSMQDEQDALALNFDRFVSQVAGVVDYRLAVVSMDTRSVNRSRGTRISTYSASPPYKLTSINESGCVPASEEPGCTLDGVDGLVDSSAMSRSEQVESFRRVVRVGTCGSGVESGLDAMKLALENLGDGCNAPFALRPEANLIIVFVTDEDDESERDLGDYINAVLAVKDPSRVRVAVVAGVIAGSPSNCSVAERGQCGRSVCELEVVGSQTPCRGPSCAEGEVCSFDGLCVHPEFAFFAQCHWCSYYNGPDCCSALASERYVEFARRMEREVHAASPEIPLSDCVSLGTRVACLAESICTENFGDTLARIAQELVIEEMPP